MIAGVDIGGTFTDIVLSDGAALTIHKLLSTPHDPSVAMLDGLRAVTGGDLSRLARVAHGSTVATNAILERKGARIALLTTEGFHDLLSIGRQNRPELYALSPSLPAPLVPRERCYGVPERLDHHGAVIRPLDMAALDAILDRIAQQDVSAVAVCLLYSYTNPTHERAIRDRIRARGDGWEVALSSDVLPAFREYERASATALEAYVRPVMARYIARLAQAIPAPLRVMKSDGGVMSAQRVSAQAIHTALSGPAAGVIGAYHIARLAGYTRVITLDMGGTSTDVALLDGAPRRRAESGIDGLPLRIGLLDIETVGAGGGSIARVDAGGALRVGPHSAGADPGPIIYGRGGVQVTVSDANAVLGRLAADHFLGGRMTLDIDAARRALTELGASLGLDALATARGVLEVANANIERAVRRVSVARGYDPREFTLVAFGGAGALHACAVAERLAIPRILIPRHPGVLCAFGLLVADVTLDASASLLGMPLDADAPAHLSARLAQLVASLRAELSAEGIAPEAMAFRAWLDMRYFGQAYELPVAFARFDDQTAASLAQAFHDAHIAAYGHALPGQAVELVQLRVDAIGTTDKPRLAPADLTPVALEGATHERADLPPGAHCRGAALIYQPDSTVYVAEGWSATVDAYHNLVLERPATDV